MEEVSEFHKNNVVFKGVWAMVESCQNIPSCQILQT